MKNKIFIIKALMLLVLITATMGVKAQVPPTWKMYLANDTLTDDRGYEFDIYMYSGPGGNQLSLYTKQIVVQLLNWQTNIVPVGTTYSPAPGYNFVHTIVPGKSDLINNPGDMNWAQTNGLAPPNIYVKSGGPIPNGTWPACNDLIPFNSPGVRVTRYRVASTLGPWKQAQPQLAWFFGGPAGNATVQYGNPALLQCSNNTHTNVLANYINPNLTLTRPLFNVKPIKHVMADVTPASKSVSCAGTVILGVSNSQANIMYRLWKKDGTTRTQVGTVDIPGNGGQINFPAVAAGTYMIRYYRDATYMLDSLEGIVVNPSVDLAVDSINFNRVAFHWARGANKFCPGATHYRVYFRSQAEPTAAGARTYVINAPSVDFSSFRSLVTNQDYYWKVQASYDNQATWEPYTDSAYFKTANPILDTTAVSFNRCVFKWKGIKYAQKYRIRVNHGGLWTALYPAGADSSYDFQYLKTNQPFYYMVDPSYDGTAWTNFTVPSMVWNTDPAPLMWETEVFQANAKLNWDKVKNATSYYIKVYDKNPSPGDTSVGGVYVTSNTFITVGLLKPNTQYWWKISPNYGNGISTWTDLKPFVTSGPPIATVYPMQFNKQTVRWNPVPGAVGYKLKYNHFITTALTDTFYCFPTTQNTLVNCYLSVDYGSGFGTFFFMNSYITPTPTMIASPIANTTATLNWQLNGNGGTVPNYNLRYKTTAASLYTLVPSVAATTYNLPSTLTPGTDYMWTISPFYTTNYWYSGSAGGYSAGAIPVTFQTTNIKLVNPSIVSAEKTNDVSIYPNPATDKVVISFDCNSAGESLVSLMDITGKVVLSKTFASIEGSNSYVINLNGISSGAYLLEIKNGEFVQTKKVVVQ